MRLFGSQDPSRFGFTAIQVSKRDYVAWIAFNRPQVLNAINLTVLQELQIAFKDALWDDAIAVVVLTGVGERAFCTGADLQEQKQFRERPRDYYKWIREFIATHELMRNLGKPIVARLNGIVVGGGNEFNLSCDLAIAADDIYLRQVGSSRGSVALAGATQFLPLMVGERRAREILLLNEEIPAAKALQWGLVNEVAPRPHNSGHHTIDSAVTSQYQQHLRAICDLPLGDTAQIQPALMLNLLGAEGHKGPVHYEGVAECLAISGVHVHLYGKALTSPFRKMGHVTITAETIEDAFKKAKIVKNTLKVHSKSQTL